MEKLDELHRRKVGGYQIRSRTQWIQFGERITKYFLGLNLEKQRRNANCTDSFRYKGGTYIHTDKDVLETAKEYYSDLYKDKSLNVHMAWNRDFFKNSVMPDEMR